MDLFSEDEEDLDVYDGNWSKSDQLLFGPDWVAEIEALESTSLEELIDSSSADGFIPKGWYECQNSIDDVLLRYGLTGERLMMQKGDELQVVKQVLTELSLDLTFQQIEWHRRTLQEKIYVLEMASPMAKRLRGEGESVFVQIIREAGFTGTSTGSATASGGGSKPFRLEEDWMVPYAGRRAQHRKSGSGLNREAQERVSQTFWAKAVVEILVEANSPVVQLASESGNPSRVLEAAVGSTRGSTMETYTKCIRIFISWLTVSFELSWPTGKLQVIEFLHVAGNKPCSPSFPLKFILALGWFEKIGGWTGEERLGSSELVKRTCDFWIENLRGGVSPLKQAPRLPWVVLAALELFVTDDRNSQLKRLKAWVMGVKAWATLREDDSQHISPKSLRVSGDLLLTELLRSKTTGASKRTRQLPVGLWIGATLTRSLWIEAGLAILSELKTEGNDFLLPRFTKAGVPTNEPMNYAESSALSKVVLSELKVPHFDSDRDEWVQGSAFLLPRIIASFWTEHSPRAVLPTAAQLLKVPKDERNYLGRWSPGGADEYGRGYRLVVQDIQQKVWSAVLSGDPRLAEFEILDRLARWAEDRNIPGAQFEEFKLSLNSCMKCFLEEIKKAGGPPNLQAIEPFVLPVQPVPSLKPNCKSSCMFLIVYTRGRKHAKLHRIGGCQWTMVSLADCQEVAKPTRSMYNSRCKLCWPSLLADALADAEGNSSGSEL